MPEFRMPSLGADMESGRLLEWLVSPGDAVHRGDVVAVVDTDKAAIEVECFDDGVVSALLVQPGEKVPVGTALAAIGAPAPPAITEPGTITEPGASPGPAAAPLPSVDAVPGQRLATLPVPAVMPAPPAVTPLAPQGVSPLVRRLARQRGVDLTAVAAAVPGQVVHRADVERFCAAGPPARTSRVRASPLARRLAAASGVDLAGVPGTAEAGAVRAEDVYRALAGARPGPDASATGPALPAKRPSVPTAEPSTVPTAEPPTVPTAAAHAPSAAAQSHASGMRRAIAELVSRANREIPHYYVSTSIDMTAATQWLRARNRELDVSERIVPAALLLLCAARAAVAVPELNGHWVDGAFRPAATVDLGTVISLRGGGIMVPVIPDAANLTIDHVMAAVRDLVERARSGRLRASALTGASITVSNLGDQGVDAVFGVVYPPQVALVGFGAVRDRPWTVDGLLGVRPAVVASLAADHRASDGAVGARFLRHIDRLLQKPEEL